MSRIACALVGSQLENSFVAYDYRRTLVEFARELSSETDLDTMLSSVGERLLETLSIKHLAFFLAEDTASGEPQFRLSKAMGANLRLTNAAPDELDLASFGVAPAGTWTWMSDFSNASG